MDMYDSSDEEQPERTIEVSDGEGEGDNSPNTLELGKSIAKYIVQAYSLGIVAKKSDLVKNFMKGQRNKDVWLMARNRAKFLIKDTFGYVLHEVHSDKDDLLFLVAPETGGSELDDDEKMQKVFLFIVLGYLMLKGPPVAETQVVEFLRKLGIASEDSLFGNVQENLNRLVSQYYLKKIKDDKTTTGEKLVRYDWGARSSVEVDREEILTKYSTILGKPVRSFVQMDVNANVQNLDAASE